MDEIINSLTVITKPKDAPKGSLAKALKKLDEIVKQKKTEAASVL